MKLVRFHHLKNEAIDRRFPRAGVLIGDDTIADLRVGYARYLTQVQKDLQGREIAALRIANDIVGMIAIGKPAREAIATSFQYLLELLASDPAAKGPMGEPLFMALADVKLHAPIRPTKIVARAGEPGAGGAMVRIKANGTINSPYRDIVMPAGVTQLTCEPKLAAIIGKGGGNIPEGDALKNVFAYMLANDVAAPGQHDMFNTFLPIGPWVVTAEEIGDPAGLAVQVRVNGKVRRDSNTKDAPVGLARLISEASGVMKLEPGDIVLHDTAADGAEAVPLNLGDRLEIEMPGLGTMRNRIGDDPSK